MKMLMFETKNTIKRINSGLDFAEEKICEL